MSTSIVYLPTLCTYVKVSRLDTRVKRKVIWISGKPPSE